MDNFELYRDANNSYSVNEINVAGDAIIDLYTLVLHQTIALTRCFLVSNGNGELITYHEEENTVIIKRDGCKELCPEELIAKVHTCIRGALDNFKSLNYDFNKIVSMSICTHRNVTVVWHKETGKSLYNALPEEDCRCEDASQKLIQKSWRKSTTNFQHLCGLPISVKWAGVKLKWLIDNISQIKDAYKSGNLRFGTLESWIVWQMTGGECYITDVTNASYTMLMNLHRCSWDLSICRFLEIDPAMLPEIKSSTEMFGKVVQNSPSGMGGLAITGAVCDTKAGIVGCQGVQPGSVNLHINTDDGASQMTVTIGEEPLFYRGILKGIGFVLSSVCCQFGSKNNAVYSLEATLCNSQNIMHWFRDCLKIVSSTDDIDSVADSVSDSSGCFFIPTTGAARGPLDRSHYRHVNLWGVNLTSTRPGHILRAALEAVAVEVSQLLSTISNTAKTSYQILTVSGRGLERSDAFCQILADYTGLRVERLAMSESIILGGALIGVMGANLDPSGLQGPIKESFSCLMVPGEQKLRCKQWICLANEQEALDHRFWIGSQDENVSFANGASQSRNKKYLSSNRNLGWKFLSVIMIGTPFTLLGFGVALLITRGRLNIS